MSGEHFSRTKGCGGGGGGGGESGPSSVAASRPWVPLQSSLGPGSESSGDHSADRGRPLLSPGPRAHSSTPPRPSRGGALGFLSNQGAPPAGGRRGLDFYVSATIPRSVCENSAGWAPRGRSADAGQIKGRQPPGLTVNAAVSVDTGLPCITRQK